MVDTKVSALSAASAALLTHEYPVNESGVAKKVTGDQLVVLVSGLGQGNSASVTTPAAGFSTDTYLVGSRCLVPATTGRGSLKIGSMYRAKFFVSKTAAGLVAPVITIRFGTAGTTADGSISALTFGVQTAVVDTGFFEIFATWRTVGTGTTATVIAGATLAHTAGAAGLTNVATGVVANTAVGTGHNSQLASAGVGLSVNGGTNAAWTITLVQAELFALG